MTCVCHCCLLSQETGNYDADISAADLQHRMHIDFGLDDVKVSRDGNCYGYSYDIEFTQALGEVPSLQVSLCNVC